VPPGGTPTNGLVAYATRRFGEHAEVWEANAAFIVRATNNHDRLVAALIDAKTRLRGAGLLGGDDDSVNYALTKLDAS
jgi:hypothetical protein